VDHSRIFDESLI